MRIQVFIDESGGKGQGNVFVMAGWLGRPEQWALFSTEWQQCLQSTPRIAYFKMREAASLSGQFKGISEASRDDKLRAFARIIRKYATAAIHCTTDLDGFAGTIEKVGKPFSDPYFWPFHITIMAACLDLVDRGSQEPVEIIFDEHSIFGRRAKLWYPIVRAMMSDPADAAVMPLEPIFRSDIEVLPLHASDMVAWLMRRTMNRHWSIIERWDLGDSLATGTTEPGDFSWLVGEELGFVEMSPHAQFMTRRRLEGIIERTNRHLREDFAGVSFPSGFQRLYQEILGHR